MNKNIKTVIESAIWLIMLLVTTLPALTGRWWWNIARGETIQSDSLAKTALTLLSAGGVLLFLLMAKQQRVVLFFFIVALIFLSKTTSATSVGGLSIFLVVIILAAVFVEAVRQNVPLYQDLRANNVNLGKIGLRSLYLWLPMVAFIGIGLAGNAWIIQKSKALIYSATPIDMYCKTIGTKDTIILPCWGLGKELSKAEYEIENYVDTVLADLRDKFRQTRSEVVNLFNESDVDDPNVLTTLAIEVRSRLLPLRIIFRFDPRVQGSQPPPIQSALDRTAATDSTYNNLRAQQRAAKDNATAAAVGNQIRAYVDGTLVPQAIQLLEQSVDQQVNDARLLYRQWLFQIRPQPWTYETPLLRNTIDPRLSVAEREAAIAFNKEEKLKFLVSVMDNIDGLESELEEGIRGFLNPESHNGHQMLGMPLAYSTASVASSQRLLSEPNLVVRVFDLKPQCTAFRLGEQVSKSELERIKNEELLFSAAEKEVINTEPFDCPDGASEESIPIKPIGIEESVGRSMERLARAEETEIDSSLRQLALDFRGAVGEGQGNATGAVGSVRNTIDLGRARCRAGFWKPGNCIANFLKKKAEQGYHTATTKLQRAATSAITAAAKESQAAGKRAIVEQRKAIIDAARAGQADLQNTIDKSFEYSQIASAILSLYFSLAVLKSFLYVVATEVFNKNAVSTINIGATSNAQGQFAVAKDVRIPGTFKVPIVSVQHGANQEKKRTFLHQPLVAIFPRLIHRMYSLNKGTHFDKTRGMVFTGPGELYLADWKMVQGEEVVFSFADFLAKSDNVEFRTRISLHLSTLLMGRYIFHYAKCIEGKGHLILKTKGVRNSKDIVCDSLDRIVAWNAQSRFKVFSDSSHKAIFIDGYQIGPAAGQDMPPGLMLTRAPGEKRQMFEGISRFIRTFLSPF